MKCAGVIFLVLAVALSLRAQDIPNPDFRETAAIPFFHKVNPDVVHFQTFYRKVLDENYTLLLIRGGAPTPGWNESHLPLQHFWWNRDDLAGLFLMETTNPNRVWELAILQGEAGLDTLEVDRADSRSLVLSVTPEKGEFENRLKLFFDVESRLLLKQFSYRPARVGKILTVENQLYFVANRERELLVGSWAGEEPSLVPKPAAPPCLSGSSV